MNGELQVYLETLTATGRHDILEKVYESLTSSDVVKSLDALEEDLLDVGRNINIEHLIGVIKSNSDLDFDEFVIYGLVKGDYLMKWHPHYSQYFKDENEMITVTALLAKYLVKYKSSIV